MGGEMTAAGDIRTVLEFLKALGIERVPINLPHGFERVPTERQGGCGDNEEALAALREAIGDCTRCGLSGGRKTMVFGEGNPCAELMFIGEGPGSEEDIQGRPFVGEAGQLLDRLIKKMGFKREDVYIGNIVKCRPPGNRDPEEEEIVSCVQFIKKQIEIISPKAIMSLGRVSSQTLLSTKTAISRLRGGFYDYDDIPVMPTFHPAYLLRKSPDKRLEDMKLVWEDALKVLERLGRKPVSG